MVMMTNTTGFSCFAAGQLGFEDASKCPQLCNFADDYLRKNKGCKDNICTFFSNDTSAESLYVKLIEEFDKCILAYFAFHWGQATHMISQVKPPLSLMKSLHHLY